MTRLAIIFSLLFVTPACAETVLYCQDELATGIGKENGSWKTGDFKLKRYTVKFDEKKMTLLLDNERFSCAPKWALYPDRIRCETEMFADFHFVFNKKTMRYSIYRMFATAWIDDGNDTTMMSHGTCQKF